MRAAELAREYGVAVELADLGEWGSAILNAEYDARGPTIRINARIAEVLAQDERERFIALAIGHELYHHRERIGEIKRSPARAARERAADAFARELAEPA